MCGVAFNRYTNSYWVCINEECDGEHHYYVKAAEVDAA